MTSLVPRASLFYRQGSAFVAKMWTLPSGCKCKDYEHRAIYTAKKVLVRVIRVCLPNSAIPRGKDEILTLEVCVVI